MYFFFGLLIVCLKTYCAFGDVITLIINSGRTHQSRQMEVNPNEETAGDLLSRVSDLIGFDSDYLVLYKEILPILTSTNMVTPWQPTSRIGCSSMCDNAEEMNAVKLSDYAIRTGSFVTCFVRPMRGDHIHQAFAIYVHGELVDTLWDQNFLGAPFASEGNTYPKTFSDLSVGMDDYHITTTHPHFGIHSGQANWFGDGFIHTHPGTSWGWFLHSTGTGAVLDAYLEQVGAAFFDEASFWYPIGPLHGERLFVCSDHAP